MTDVLIVNPPSPDGHVYIRDMCRWGRKSREKMVWPQSSLAYLAALASGSRADRDWLGALADDAGVDPGAVVTELARRHSLYDDLRAERLEDEVYPHSMEVVRNFRKSPDYRRAVAAKLGLGSDAMAHLGNLYTAALPAWLAAGLEEAGAAGVDLAGAELLLLGYGSGDAAEAIPLTVQPGWREAAERIKLDAALAEPVDLTRAQYEALHDYGTAPGLEKRARGEFLVERIGEVNANGMDERGIPHHQYVEAESAITAEPLAASAQ